MATFELKSQLPVATRAEINRIEAIPSAQRLDFENTFLTTLAPYLTNAVDEYDSAGLILTACGNTLPTGYSGFKKGCLFTKLDASGNGLYQNTGTSTSATWTQIIDTDTDNNLVTTGTPVNAVAATKTLTVSGVPTDNDTVTIGATTYTFESAINASGVAATGTLTVADVPHDTNNVVIGANTYLFKTALTEKKATGTLTATGNFVDAETVTIGTKTYKFTVNLSTPAVADEVKIGSSASDSLDNLIAAINGAAGVGTNYGTGTVAHTLVTAAAGAGDTMTITAKTIGTAGNDIATTVSAASCSFGDTTLKTGAASVANEVLIGVSAEASIDNLVLAITAGSGAGTNYSTATVVHPTCTAVKASAATMTVTAKSVGDAGNAIATTAQNHGSFGAATLAGGEGVDSANMVLIGASAELTIDNLVLAINAGAGAGTNYGTGTVANASVTAAKTAADTMTITAKVKGSVGNSIVLGESGSNTAWAAGATTMSGGVNGTVGGNGAMLKDSSYLYITVAANTTADTNWRRISVGTAY